MTKHNVYMAALSSCNDYTGITAGDEVKLVKVYLHRANIVLLSIIMHHAWISAQVQGQSYTMFALCSVTQACVEILRVFLEISWLVNRLVPNIDVFAGLLQGPASSH